MQTKFPSVKALMTIKDVTQEQAKECRAIMAARSNRELFPLIDSCPVTNNWAKACFNQPSFHELKMSALNELLDMHGVELIERGHNQKSPAIEYLNAGDTYTTTLMFVNGQYRVGCWGDIVERGSYD